MVINVIEYMRSFSASSSRVCIQPKSRFIERRERRCMRVAATMPGTQDDSLVNSMRSVHGAHVGGDL